MKKFLIRFKNRDGSTEMISSIVVLVVLISFLAYSITMFGEVSKIDSLQQMAQQMARSIALEGDINAAVNTRLADLEETFSLDVNMSVEGDYVSGQKLRTESDFKVVITHVSNYSFGGVINQSKTKTYQGVAHGTVEEYHKGS